MTRERRTTESGPATRRIVALCLLLAACSGGGGGGDGSTAPTDNSVSRVDISPTAPAALVSGATTTLSATAFTKDNRSLGSSGVTWSSSSDAIASVAGGVVTAHLVGTATITASSSGISSAGVTVTVSAGAAAQLGIRTQPGGAAAGAAMTTQPIVEVRDAAGNLVTSSAVSVTVALTSGGGALTGAASVNAIAGVATFSGLTVAGLIGAYTMTFSATGLTAATSASFTLAAGVATQIAIRTQPVAASAYAVFTTPAVIEIRDAGGNVTTSTALVSVAIASGGGVLAGATAVNAVAGVATFTTLQINGTAGARVLTFTSGTFPAVSTTSFAVAAAPPAVITATPSPAIVNATVGQNPAAVTVALTNTGAFPLTNLRLQSISYSPTVPGGWLTATFPAGTSAPASLQLNVTSASFALGTYTATLTLAGDGTAGNTTLTVTLNVLPQSVNAFGTAANKVNFVNIGATFSPGLVTKTGAGVVTTTDATVTYAARSPAIATVDATGRITAVAPGQAWIVATSTATNSDSVLVIVPLSAGVILQTDITTFNYHVNDIVTLKVLVNTRGASLGAVTATVTWPVFTGSAGVFGSMTFLDISVAGSPMAPVTTVDQNLNVIRINGLSTSGATGTVLLATIRFTVRTSGLTGVYLNASELLAVDLSSLLATATFTQYPVIVP
jgi:hypothetical protein